MTKPYKVSVIIPCFNHGEFLPEAIASVTNLGREDIEIIVVNDGSTDERTREIMDEVVARGIKVIHQENKGLAAARNAAIAASQGQYVFPLDADDRLRPGWIDNGIRILDSNPQVGVVYGDAECFGTRNLGPFDQDRLLYWNYIHASALYRRSVWEQNRGYDGTMPVQGFEDWDFWLGALKLGWQFAYVPEVFFDYRQAEQSMITRTQRFESKVDAFAAMKHGLLYQQAWGRLEREHESVKATCRNLGRLLKSRFRSFKMEGIPSNESLCGDWKPWAAMALGVSEPLNYYSAHGASIRNKSKREGLGTLEAVEVVPGIIEREKPTQAGEILPWTVARFWPHKIMSPHVPLRVKPVILQDARAIDPSAPRKMIHPAWVTVRLKIAKELRLIWQRFENRVS